MNIRVKMLKKKMVTDKRSQFILQDYKYLVYLRWIQKNPSRPGQRPRFSSPEYARYCFRLLDLDAIRRRILNEEVGHYVTLGNDKQHGPKFTMETDLIMILTRLITNPHPSLVLRAYGRCCVSPLLVVSISMAEELVWIVLNERYRDKTRRYFDMKKKRRRKFLKKVFQLLKRVYLSMTEEFIESQVHLIHSLVFRIGRDFDDVFRRRFTRIGEICDIFAELYSRRKCRVPENCQTAAYTDQAYYILGARLVADRCDASRWPNIETARREIPLYYPTGYSALKYGRNRKDLFARKNTLRHCAFRKGDLRFEDTETIKRLAVYDEIFTLFSNPTPYQLILDTRTAKVLISTTMCHELCWSYLSTTRKRFLRGTKELTRAIYVNLIHRYVGFKREDVQNGLLFLLNIVESERGRGVSRREIFSLERRKEIFERKVQPYVLLSKYGHRHHELVNELLGRENPSEADVYNKAYDTFQRQYCPVISTIRSCPTFIIEWRHQLLSRDWSVLLHRLTKSGTRISFPSLRRQDACKNLWRLLVEAIRYCHTTEISAAELLELIEDVINLGPVKLKTDDRAQHLQEIAWWYMGTKGFESSARRYSPSVADQETYRRGRIVHVNKLERIYDCLLSYYELATTPDSNFNDHWHDLDLSKIVGKMKEDVVSFRGAAGILELIVSILNRLGQPVDAAELLERYLEAYPSDYSVYQLAIKELLPKFGVEFGMRLMDVASWHPVVVDWSKYEIGKRTESVEKHGEPTNHSAVVCKLLDFLDYGTNKDRDDAWGLLADALLKADVEDTQSIANAWNERKSWWPKFHLKRTTDAALLELKQTVLGALEAFE